MPRSGMDVIPCH